MMITRKDLIQHITRAEQLYAANLYSQLASHITAVQEHFEQLEETDYARFYRIVMLYICAFEDVNMPVMESYLEALESIGEVEASDYELICSYYTQCDESIYKKAVVAFPYNDTLHLHYALKLQHDKRYADAILILEYILECYPALTEVRFLLHDVQTAQLLKLCASEEAAHYNDVLTLASATHNLDALTGLEMDPRLDPKSKTLIHIQLSIWNSKSVEIAQHWQTEWKLLDLTPTTRYLLADYAQSFMRYDLVAQILRAPKTPEFPEDNFSTFDQYKVYMQDLANSGWQLAQHHYLLVGNSAYYHTGDDNIFNICVKQGLAQNPKNPLLLVLKAKYFYSKEDYNQTGAAYHEAFKNGLRLSEYLFYLLEVNNRIKSWQGILDIVKQFHKGQTPTLKTLFFQARALVNLQQHDAALEVINEALEDFPHPAHSYAPWLYNMRMEYHRKNHNYDAFLEDLHKEVGFYKTGDNDYCQTINCGVEALFEKEDYEECYNYAIYNHEQGKLYPHLYPVFQWICFYEFALQKPDDLEDVTTADLVTQPSTFIDYRNNGLIYWILEDYIAAANALQQAANLATNKALYLRLAIACANEGFNYDKSEILCEIFKTETPEARNWRTDYDYCQIILDKDDYQEAYKVFSELLQSYPETSFYAFPRAFNNMFASVFRDCSKGMNNLPAFHKYTAMHLSNDNPSVYVAKEEQTYADQHYTNDLFLRHNLLEYASRLECGLTDVEKDALLQIKSTISNTYFV